MRVEVRRPEVPGSVRADLRAVAVPHELSRAEERGVRREVREA